AVDLLWGRWASAEGRWRRTQVVARRVAVVAGLAIGAQLSGPAWLAGTQSAMADDVVAPQRAATSWIVAHVPHTSRVIVDDSMWVDLVRAGFNRKFGVVWFYKLDSSNNLDP